MTQTKTNTLTRSLRCGEASLKEGKIEGQDYILTLACCDAPGIVASIAGTIAEIGGNIVESSQFGDPQTGRFFMRVKFLTSNEMCKSDIMTALEQPGEKYQMEWRLYEAGSPTKTVIMASKTDHCLNDLVYRWRIGTLPIDIVRIISNHKDVERIAELNNIPFTYAPITKETKESQEQQLRELFVKDGAELIVLARYMQILSDKLSQDYFGSIINIHHSFLPGFKGAKPYHRAHDRGVKLIGATAHYVTPDLDEGPIIEQEIERVNHAMSVKDLIAAGRDIERRVLAKAVKYHIEHRVLINDGKTVVFL
ncbi:MAG: formyltetrahydrofolate deformylase [Rhizobiales bacterium]|nr:formyltetrahydrofolate deformylase [Hyphomicrobiales bacterium]